MLKNAKILLNTHDHDIIVISCRDDHELFPFTSQLSIKILRLFDRNERVLLPVYNEGRDRYISDHLHTFLVDLLQVNRRWRNSKKRDDPHHTAKAALNDEALDTVRISIGQLQGRDTP